MIQSVSKQKKLIYISISIAVVLLALFAYMASSKDSSEISSFNPSALEEEHIHTHGGIEPDTTPIDPRSDRVFIKDFHKLENILNLDTRENIEHRLYLATVKASGNNPGLYTGVVRPESYSNVSSDSSDVFKLLVDIEPANLTYEATIVFQKRGGGGVVYIACAPDEKQMSRSSMCKQGAA